MANTVEAGRELVGSLATPNVLLLADIFHMNIEEQDIASAFRAGADRIGHVHFVDSNRRPAGSGHVDFAPIAAALREIGYDRYVSAEAFPYPDPEAAAAATIAAFRRYFEHPEPTAA
jgi:sugar phosphate isomerase/epimerase